jgi:hypothetical protein
MQQRTNGQHATALEKFMGGGFKEQVIVDPAAAAFKAELSSRGAWVTDADNGVGPGIASVSTMFHTRRLIVNKDECPRLCKGIPEYSWDPRAAKLGEEAPVKVNDDEVDALRYGVHGKIPVWRVAGV